MNGLLDDEDPIVVFSFLQTGCETLQKIMQDDPNHVIQKKRAFKPPCPPANLLLSILCSLPLLDPLHKEFTCFFRHDLVICVNPRNFVEAFLLFLF